MFQCLLIAMACGQTALAGEESAWRRYDQSADLAALARHENESMRFQLLLSKTLDKNTLWQPFLEELRDFGEAGYERLKPIVLEKDIAELQSAVAAGKLSYEELTTFYIYRIRKIELDERRYLNAVISLNPQAILNARQADVLRRQGREVESRSVFGMPILLKDNIGAVGMPTTAGAIALRDNETDDAWITRQLKAAGAVILGKANLSEWAYFFCRGCPSGYSALGGQTLNPYGRFDFGPGGSSSGSAVAAAANLAAATVGSETSGSILSPASSTSAVGLKPTTGALSRTGIVPISSTLDTAGPITRTVADAAILFNAMVAYDEQDPAMPLSSADLRLKIREAPTQGKRLGALKNLDGVALYRESLNRLSAAGANLVETEIPEFDSSGFRELLGADMVRDLPRYLRGYGNPAVSIASMEDLQAFNNEAANLRAPYGQELVDMMVGLALTDDELQALRQRLQSAARSALDSIFDMGQLDVLVSYNNRHAQVAALANYPALTVPMGYDENGRPMGLTFIAPPFEEQRLIDMGLQFERLSDARRAPAAYR